MNSYKNVIRNTAQQLSFLQGNEKIEQNNHILHFTEIEFEQKYSS